MYIYSLFIFDLYLANKNNDIITNIRIFTQCMMIINHIKRVTSIIFNTTEKSELDCMTPAYYSLYCDLEFTSC